MIFESKEDLSGNGKGTVETLNALLSETHGTKTQEKILRAYFDSHETVDELVFLALEGRDDLEDLRDSLEFDSQNQEWVIHDDGTVRPVGEWPDEERRDSGTDDGEDIRKIDIDKYGHGYHGISVDVCPHCGRETYRKNLRGAKSHVCPWCGRNGISRVVSRIARLVKP